MSDDIKELDVQPENNEVVEAAEAVAEEVTEEVKDVKEVVVEEAEKVEAVKEEVEEKASQYASDNAVEVETDTKIAVQSQIPEKTEVVAVAAAAAAAEEQSKKAIKKQKADEKARKKAEAKQAKKAKKKKELEARINACPKEYKPVTTAKYFWLYFFAVMPVIGIIISIILAIVPYNKNVKSFGRAMLLHHAMWIILILIAALIIFIALGGDAVMDIIKAFGSFFEELAHSFGF